MVEADTMGVGTMEVGITVGVEDTIIQDIEDIEDTEHMRNVDDL